MTPGSTFWLCFFFFLLRRPPNSTRTDTLCPYTTPVRSGPDVEQTDSIASLTEPSRGEIADKTRATGNKVLHLYAPSRAHDAAVFNEILPLWRCMHYDGRQPSP